MTSYIPTSGGIITGFLGLAVPFITMYWPVLAFGCGILLLEWGAHKFLDFLGFYLPTDDGGWERDAGARAKDWVAEARYHEYMSGSGKVGAAPVDKLKGGLAWGGAKYAAREMNAIHSVLVDTPVPEMGSRVLNYGSWESPDLRVSGSSRSPGDSSVVAGS